MKFSEVNISRKLGARETPSLGNAFLVRDCYIWQSDIAILRFVRTKIKRKVADKPEHRQARRDLYLDCLAAIEHERDLCREWHM